MYMPPKRKSINKAERQKVFEKYNGHCAYCGCEITLKTMQIDHLIPMDRYEVYKAEGKDIDSFDNYMPACRSCNKYKSTYRLEDLRKMIERQPEILMRDKPTYALAVRFGVVIPNPKKVVFFFERSENNG